MVHTNSQVLVKKCAVKINLNQKKNDEHFIQGFLEQKCEINEKGGCMVLKKNCGANFHHCWFVDSIQKERNKSEISKC